MRRLGGGGGALALMLRLFMGHVMPDRAAYGGAGQGVVACNVAGNATYHGTLYAACRLGGEGSGQEGGGECNGAGETTDVGHVKGSPAERAILPPQMPS